jgi:hypothetical protein
MTERGGKPTRRKMQYSSIPTAGDATCSRCTFREPEQQGEPVTKSQVAIQHETATKRKVQDKELAGRVIAAYLVASQSSSSHESPSKSESKRVGRLVAESFQ